MIISLVPRRNAGKVIEKYPEYSGEITRMRVCAIE